MRIFLIMCFLCITMTQAVLAADYCSFGNGREWSYSGDLNGIPVNFVQSVMVAGEQGKNNIVYAIESRMNGTTMNTFKFNFHDNALFLRSKINSFGETLFSPPRKEMICNAKVGDKWTWKSNDSSDFLKYEAIRKEKIHVPAGNFDAIVIKTKGIIDGVQIKESLSWYADGVGTVKEFVDTGSIKMIRKLTSYKTR